MDGTGLISLYVAALVSSNGKKEKVDGETNLLIVEVIIKKEENH